MAPSVAETATATTDLHDMRPLKRARKAVVSRPRESEDHGYTENAPVDHIFIAEGNVAKKPGGKKAPLSCCECRRLKLKCDRSFPCASCKKRGCAEICPEGVLVSGKGTRFILANTEQLHTKIHDMSDRIRHLEEALEALQSQHYADPHPLLHPDLLGVKSTMGLYGGTQVGAEGGAGGVENGNGNERDRSNGPAVGQIGNGVGMQMQVQMDVDGLDRGSSEEAQKGLITRGSPGNDNTDPLLNEVIRLSYSYPLPDNVSPEPNLPLRSYIRGRLPDRAEAEYLWDQARQNALWQYNPHPSETFFPNLSHHCYTSPIEDLSPRRLALLFMILAVGCLVDLHKRGPDSPDAERYHQFARASLCEIPVMEETNVETVTALFYEIWYLLVFSDKKKAAGYAWGLMGLTAKLAQSIGLHRNGGNSKVIPEEVEKRRSLFWELLYLDARLSLSLGRPPSLSIRYMDCQRPSYMPDHGCDPSESLHYYQEWKHSCYLECLAPVLDLISDPSINYNKVIALDTKIRDFAFPTPLRSGAPLSHTLIMQKASLSTALEAVLLQLHRTYFTRALSGPEEAFNRRHKYAPSVVAVFLSASRMIATVQDLYHREPHLTARILGYWSNAFSAAVALCLLVSRAPFTCLSPAVLQELERARMLFNSAKDVCPRALQVIPILETMVEKANNIYNRWVDGQEIQTVLQHVVNDYHESDGNRRLSISAAAASASAGDFSDNFNSNPNSNPNSSSNGTPVQNTTDSFTYTHWSLAQCIVEVHQRAKTLFPQRKPCQCSVAVTVPCPPSHFWSPPPTIQQASPVLPDLYSGSFQVGGVLPSTGPAIPIPEKLSPASKMALVDTINFELGALNSAGDQNWMAFF